MKDNLIVTIGRQYGSGGREVAQNLAANMGLGYYDRRLIVEASRMSGICKEILEREDEKQPRSWSHALPFGFGFDRGLSAEAIYKIQSDAIKEIAMKESAVIVGRSADYVLRNSPLCFNIFIIAPEEERVKRIMRRANLSKKEAIERMYKTDRRRAAYYNFYTNKDWGATESYHFTIDSSLMGIEKTAELLQNFVCTALQTRGVKLCELLDNVDAVDCCGGGNR